MNLVFSKFDITCFIFFIFLGGALGFSDIAKALDLDGQSFSPCCNYFFLFIYLSVCLPNYLSISSFSLCLALSLTFTFTIFSLTLSPSLSLFLLSLLLSFFLYLFPHCVYDIYVNISYFHLHPYLQSFTSV